MSVLSLTGEKKTNKLHLYSGLQNSYVMRVKVALLQFTPYRQSDTVKIPSLTVDSRNIRSRGSI